MSAGRELIPAFFVCRRLYIFSAILGSLFFLRKILPLQPLKFAKRHFLCVQGSFWFLLV